MYNESTVNYSPFHTNIPTQPPRLDRARFRSFMDETARLTPIDRFQRLAGHVIDLSDPSERTKPSRSFRGAHLGALAHRVLTGDYPILNAGDLDNPVMHFAPYIYADRVARTIATDDAYTETQFPNEVRNVVSDELSLPDNFRFPSIVFALVNKSLLRPSDMGSGHGYVYDGIVTPDMIDAHSRRAIEQLIKPL